MEYLRKQDPELVKALGLELQRQRDNLELIASENIVSRAVLEAMGTVLTNKYAEGYPGKRYYGGCEYVDIAEEIARNRAKELFGAEHANVQPHSGAQANMAVYLAVPGIRCALVHDLFSAKATREHNDSNVLAMGERVIGPGLAQEIVRVWLETPFSQGERHVNRVNKVMAIERRQA